METQALTFKLHCLAIALLLLLLEQLKAGTGASQEQPEALPQRARNGSRHGFIRGQRPPRTQFRSLMCIGLYSPLPCAPHPHTSGPFSHKGLPA